MQGCAACSLCGVPCGVRERGSREGAGWGFWMPWRTKLVQLAGYKLLQISRGYFLAICHNFLSPQDMDTATAQGTV